MALPLASCNTQESRLRVLPGQHSGAGSGGVGGGMTGELTLPPADGTTGWLSWSSRVCLPWEHGWGRASRLGSSATIQAQIQGSELAHLKVYILCELLEHGKGPICWSKAAGSSWQQQDIRGVQEKAPRIICCCLSRLRKGWQPFAYKSISGWILILAVSRVWIISTASELQTTRLFEMDLEEAKLLA